ncbi:MAG: hypothetical protein HOI15_10975 [Opitutales bacterium]|nr:hypothetical protein [Opitutales bacterium]MBT6767384.1 hypothetical protein [Opitutales bacterium]
METEELVKISEKTKGDLCSVGGCGGPGMCPGTALLIGFLVGTGLVSVTGIQWLLPVSAIVIGGLFISGIWQRFWRR